MPKLAPFTQRQVDWFIKSVNSWFNVAEGGKRAGKNVLEVHSFCAQLEEHENHIHLAAGVSIASAKLNVLDCDGLGMLNYFKGRCREGVYKNRDCLYVQTKMGEKVILVSGGGKANDYKLIKGNTYGMALITEVNECHKSFVQEVFDRTLSSENRKIFHDLNPKAPKDPYYTEIEAFHKEKQQDDPNYGYNYGHFTIADNLSISDEKLRQLLNTYNKGSLWYKRDMLGLRIVADGLIYTNFANKVDMFKLDELPKAKGTEQTQRGFISIGVDFGGTGSGHAFNATWVAANLKQIITIEDYWNDEEMDPTQLTDEFIKFIVMVKKKYKGITIVDIAADSAEQVLIRGFNAALIKAKLGIQVTNATKGVITQRIKFYQLLMALGAYKILNHCEHTIDAFETALWEENDKQEDIRLDNGTTNIDTLDSQEYSTEKWHEQIMKVLNYTR